MFNTVVILSQNISDDGESMKKQYAFKEGIAYLCCLFSTYTQATLSHNGEYIQYTIPTCYQHTHLLCIITHSPVPL